MNYFCIPSVSGSHAFWRVLGSVAAEPSAWLLIPTPALPTGPVPALSGPVTCDMGTEAAPGTEGWREGEVRLTRVCQVPRQASGSFTALFALVADLLSVHWRDLMFFGYESRHLVNFTPFCICAVCRLCRAP